MALTGEHSPIVCAVRCPFRLVAYHAQQCVEKYLKAYLVLHGVWGVTLGEAEELTPLPFSPDTLAKMSP